MLRKGGGPAPVMTAGFQWVHQRVGGSYLEVGMLVHMGLGRHPQQGRELVAGNGHVAKLQPVRFTQAHSGPRLTSDLCLTWRRRMGSVMSESLTASSSSV